MDLAHTVLDIMCKGKGVKNTSLGKQFLDGVDCICTFHVLHTCAAFPMRCIMTE